ncbi:AMP-binding protein [Paracoccus sp. PAR01]|nr:AMP-binding protein [Paracoccus sp. PAR01]
MASALIRNVPYREGEDILSKPWIRAYGDAIPHEIVTDSQASVVALLDQAAQTYGDLPALECFGQTMSYAEVDGQGRAFAAWLQHKLGVHPGERIALMCPNIFAFPIAMHGIIRSGAVQVNVNPLYTPRELLHQLNDAGVQTIVIYGGATPTLAEILDQTQIRNIVTVDPGDGAGLDLPSPPVDPRITAIRFADALAQGAALRLDPVALASGDNLFLQYTGGTTGLSKGAVLTHGNLVANTRQFRAILPEACDPGREVLVLALPLYHIFGLMQLLTFTAIGAKAVLIPNPRDGDRFIDAIRHAKFSVIPGVNTLFQALMAHPRFNEIDLSGYKVAIGGGAAVIPATSEQWKALTGHHIKEAYGLSETSPLLCINPMSVTDFTGSCGLPVPSSEVMLLDDAGQPAAPGSAGEICCRGPQVTKGYWNRDADSAASFTPDGFFRTGDIGYFTEAGFLKIIDRKKDMVLVSGFNVYPNEIEAVVTACPGIAECACIGVPDPKTGEALRIYAVKLAGAELTEEQVIAHCRKEMTSYKVPRQIVFLDALPKSNVGKILRRELRDRA